MVLIDVKNENATNNTKGGGECIRREKMDGKIESKSYRIKFFCYATFSKRSVFPEQRIRGEQMRARGKHAPPTRNG